jgi:CheY-like chemotaxis protein
MNEIERILAYHRNDSGKVVGAGEQRKRVLVVEGDGFTRITLMNWLLAAGFEVDFAPNGRLGLHQLRMWEPDTVIMELNLRDLPGLEFIRRARQEGRFRKRPIYVFTSTHFVKRATGRELEAMGVKVFDKLSIAPETLVVKVAAELNGEGLVENGEWARRARAEVRRQKSDGRPGKWEAGSLRRCRITCQRAWRRSGCRRRAWRDARAQCNG